MRCVLAGLCEEQPLIDAARIPTWIGSRVLQFLFIHSCLHCNLPLGVGVGNSADGDLGIIALGFFGYSSGNLPAHGGREECRGHAALL